MIRRGVTSSVSLPLLLLLVLSTGGLACRPSTQRREVPEPGGLGLLGTEVQEQYADYRQALERLRQEPEPRPAELARAWGQLGMWHDLYEYLDGAEACYRNAEELDPSDPRWPYYLGHVFRRRGRFEEAREAFRRVLAVSPHDLPSLVWLGEADIDDGRPDAAEVSFRAALERDPGSVRAMLGLGKVALARRDFQAAVVQLEQALARQPSATEIHYALGLAYRGQGQIELAQQQMALGQVANRDRVPVALDDPLRTDLVSLRRDTMARNRQAKRLLDEGRVEEAIAELRKLVEADPDTADWRINLAMALQRAGQDAAAIEQLEEILRRQPRHAKAHFSRAVIRSMRPDLAGAEADYRAALAADPAFLEAQFNLGNLLRETTRFAEALEHYQRAIEIDPANQLARFWRASCEIALGRFVEARRDLEQDLEQVAEGADGLRLLLSRLLAAAPDPAARDGDRALVLAEDAFRRSHNLVHAETVAMALAEQGRYGQAVAWQEACLAAAQSGGLPEAVAWVRARLASYRGQRAARAIWATGEHPTPIEVEAPELP